MIDDESYQHGYEQAKKEIVNSIEQIVLEVLEREKDFVNQHPSKGIFEEDFPSVAKQVAERLKDDP